MNTCEFCNATIPYEVNNCPSCGAPCKYKTAPQQPQQQPQSQLVQTVVINKSVASSMKKNHVVSMEDVSINMKSNSSEDSFFDDLEDDLDREKAENLAQTKRSVFGCLFIIIAVIAIIIIIVVALK